MYHGITFIAAFAFIIPGIFMALVPMLPALSYMFVIALVYAIFDKFVSLSAGELVILLCITLVSIAVDHTAGLLGAKYGGAHTKSLLWGMAGAIVGAFVFPAFGSFPGLFLGVLFAELYYKKPHDKAVKAAGSALVGSAVGVGINVVLSIVFAICFFFFAIS